MAADPRTTKVPASATSRIIPTVTLLSFVAGSMDAIAFIGLGEVFTSAMSGNTVLLGVAAAQANLAGALRALTAIIGYVVGVAIASLPWEKAGGGGPKLVIEAVFVIAFAALWFSLGGPGNAAAGYILIALSSIAMGVQGAIGHMLGIAGLMTVVFISTYTAIVSGLTERLVAADRPLLTDHARRQVLALVAYLVGALLGGVVATWWLAVAPVVPLAAFTALVTCVFLRIFRIDPAERR